MSNISDLSNIKYPRRAPLSSHQQQQQQQQQAGVMRRRSTVELLSTRQGGNGNNVMRLHLQAIPLVGRDTEQACLRQALARACDNDDIPHTQVALVTGAAGTGKSAMVGAAFTAVNVQQQNVWYCLGKFDQLHSQRPWQAIIDAFDRLGRIVMESSDDVQNVRERLHQQLPAADAVFLASIIPAMADLLQVMPRVRASTFEARHAFQILQRLLRVVLVCVSQVRPVVMVIEDLQWAGNDMSSVDLLSALVAPERIRNLLLVCVFREHEMQHDHPLLSLKNVMPGGVHVPVGSLTIEAVTEIVAHVIQSSEERAYSLAAVVTKKTDGNALFVMQFLRMLEERQLINFSYMTYQWEWDEYEIAASTDVSGNVVGLLVQKVSALPSEIQHVLKVGACVGARFDIDTIAHVVGASSLVLSTEASTILSDVGMQCGVNDLDQQGPHVACDRLVESLNLAVSEHLLDQLPGTTTYKFAHDQIQQALYVLLPQSKERSKLHIEIGKFLLSRYRRFHRPDPMDLLAAVDQMNHGCSEIQSDEPKLELAELNFEAAQIVARLSAFPASTAYLESARTLLEQLEGWRLHYDLMLNVSSKLALSYWIIGKLQSSRGIIEEVLIFARSLCDKISCYHTMMHCEMAEGKIRQAFRLGVSILRQLKVSFPMQPTKRDFAKEYRFTRAAIARVGIGEGLLRLETALEWQTIAAMTVLAEMLQAAFGLNDIIALRFVSARMTRLTVSQGLCKESPLAFTAYSLTVASVSADYEDAFNIGEIALRVADRLCVKAQKGRALMAVCHFINHWGRPVHTTLNRALEAHQLCLDDGDIHYAGQCLMCYVWHYFWAGLPLQPLLKDHEQLVKFFTEYQQTHQLLLHNTGSLVVRIMTGLVPRANAFRYIEEGVGDEWALPKVVASWVKQVVSVYFHDIEILQSEGATFWKNAWLKRDSSHECTVRFFYLGLAESILYGATRRRKHVRRCRAVLKQMHTWVKRGNCNCTHMEKFLQAELEQTKRRASVERVSSAYEAAIVSAARSGFINHTALANERLALYLLPRDQEKASYYMTCAWQYYAEWNSDAKVDDLKARYGALIHESATAMPCRASGHLLGRARVQSTAPRQYHSKWHLVQHPSSSAYAAPPSSSTSVVTEGPSSHSLYGNHGSSAFMTVTSEQRNSFCRRSSAKHAVVMPVVREQSTASAAADRIMCRMQASKL